MPELVDITMLTLGVNEKEQVPHLTTNEGGKSINIELNRQTAINKMEE